MSVSCVSLFGLLSGTLAADMGLEGQVAYALRHFDEDGDGALSRKELLSLLENLKDTVATLLVSAGEQYPFDISVVPVSLS